VGGHPPHIATPNHTNSRGASRFKEKLSYGLGDFGNGFMFDLGQAYLLKF